MKQADSGNAVKVVIAQVVAVIVAAIVTAIVTIWMIVKGVD